VEQGRKPASVVAGVDQARGDRIVKDLGIVIEGLVKSPHNRWNFGSPASLGLFHEPAPVRGSHFAAWGHRSSELAKKEMRMRGADPSTIFVNVQLQGGSGPGPGRGKLAPLDKPLVVRKNFGVVEGERGRRMYRIEQSHASGVVGGPRSSP